MIYMYIYILLLNSVVMFVFSLILMFKKYSILVEWKIMEVSCLSLEFILLFDWISLMFVCLVSLISGFVLIYSVSYMSGDKNLNRFFFLVLLFVFSMYLMVLSPNIMSILLGWDGLGLISYSLVIYYQNFKSLNCGMVTVLSNRIGDVGILMMIGLLMSLGSWNLFFYSLEKSYLSFFLLISACTKSAQLPFSVWLPMAMAAPTPVSSLVHSSTLVTAGVYLLMRYNNFLMSGINSYLLMLSSLTMLMSGFVANFETDLKKIIALSTLSQLGLMMSILSLGEVEMGFFHLVIHALFKSLLFMCSGMIIHLMMNNQDIRFIGGVIKIYPLLSVIFFISSLSLCGFPFLSGFYSKDLIMEWVFMSKMNFFSMCMLILATLFTVSYSVRLLIQVFLNSLSVLNFVIIKSEDKLMSYSMSILFFFSICGGWMFINLFFFIEKIIILKFIEKILVLIICGIGSGMGWFIQNFKINMSNYLKIFISKMFGLEEIYMKLYFYPNKGSMWIYKNLDKGVIEYILIFKFKNLFNKILNFYSFNYITLKKLFFYMMFFILLFMMF